MNTNLLAALLCVILFSLTVPFTRIATTEMSPEAVILVRLIGAALVCLGLVFKNRWTPPREIWGRLVMTSVGSVIGFSALIGFAMREVPSGHAVVALASMPVFTAAYSSMRDRSRPGLKFWFFAVLGTLLSFSFFFLDQIDALKRGDLLLVLAVFAGGFGYVEGGRLSRTHGGTNVMAWSILLSLPIVLPLAVLFFYHSPLSLSEMSGGAIFSVSYLALVSQSGGMFLWLRVLAVGPMEKVALLQLLQPFFSLLASVVLVGETVSPAAWMIAVGVAACVLGANRAKGGPASSRAILSERKLRSCEV